MTDDESVYMHFAYILYIYCMAMMAYSCGAAGGADCFFGTEGPSLAERECHISRKCGWGTVIWHAVAVTA